MKRQFNKLKLGILLYMAASFGSQALAHPYYNGQDVGGTSMIACFYNLTATTGTITKELTINKTTYTWQHYELLSRISKLYGWVDVATASSYYPTATGRYRVQYSSYNLFTGITTTSYSDEVTITEFGVPSVASITVPAETCNGMVTLTANANSFTGTIDWKKYSNGTWIVIPGDGNTLRPTFSISDINNYYLQVTVSNSCATSSISTPAPVAIKQLNTETVALSTTAKNLCLNEVGVISAVVGNVNTAYQPTYQYSWQYSSDNGAAWTTITSSAGIYSNYTTKDLSIKPADASINAYRYRCTVTGKCATATSNACVVTVKTPPSIGSLTAPGLACKNTTSSATVVLNGDAPVVSWIVDGSEQSSTALTINKLMPATDSTTVNFTAVASSGFCAATESKSVYTTTYPALKAKIDLRNADCNGTTKILSAAVSGGKPDYSFLWSSGSKTTQELSITSIGSYSVTVSDACSNTTSSTLYVDAVSSPFTASFAQTDITCNGLNNGTVTVTASGGTTPFKYTITSTVAPKLTGTLNHLAPSVFANLAPGKYSISLTDGCGANITKDVVITEPAPLVSSITEYTDAKCNGKGGGSATVSVSGGTAPYTYIWDNGQRTAQSIGLLAGEYLVNVVDRNACLTTSTVTITEPGVLEASVFTADVKCHGEATGTANIQVTGGTEPYTYRWNNGLTASSSDALAEGSYRITVADFCNDEMVIEADISQPAKFTYSLTHTGITCKGASNGTANFVLSGGTQPYSMMWDDSTTIAYRTHLNAGTYRIYAGDACHDTIIDSVVIVQPDELIAVIDTTPVSCYGKVDGTATVTVSGGTEPYSYLWSNGQKSPKAELLFAGAYMVQVLDAQGCLTSAQTIITEPGILEASVFTTDANCHGEATGTANVQVTGGTEPYTYRWSNGLTASSSDTLAEGSYLITVTDFCNDERIIEADISQPEKLTYSLTHTGITCFGASNGTANFVVTGGILPYSIKWDDNTSVAYRTDLNAGTYRIYAGDACHDTIIDSVVIVQPDELIAIIDTTPVSCYGNIDGTATVSVSGGTEPYSYLWSNGQKSPKAELLFAGVYMVQVLDAQGCLTSAQNMVTQPEPLNVETRATAAACSVSTGSVEAIATGGTAPYSYAWSNQAVTSAIESIPAGSYTVTVTDKNNCTASAVSKVNVTVKQYPICIVTVDTASKSNRIVWEKDQDPSVDSWNIYSYYGSYRKIGAVKASDDYSIFDDLMAKPRQTSHQYAISTVDKCGNESPLSFSHSTMLAWSNYSTEPNKANIEWTPYFDESREFEPEYYYIFKGNSAKTMELIDSVPGRSTVYIDEANNGAKYYRVGFTRKTKCFVTGLKSDSGPYSQSLSNLSESIILNAEELASLGMSVDISPVPATDAATITVSNPQGKEFSLSISDLVGNVSELASGICQDTYSIGCSLQDKPSGTYLVQLQVGESIFTHKLVVVK